MPKVTSLVVQKRNRERVNVYLDGKFAFGLTALEAIRLRVGQELSAEDIARLQDRDEVAVAHDRALRYLGYRPRSQAELRKYLTGKEFAPEVVAEVLARLERVGLIDDKAFAEYWRQNRENFRPKGAHALRQELRQKGVARDVIDASLAGLNEESAALELARARAQRLRGLDKLTFKRRMAGYLGRRGYGFDVIGPVLEKVWAELASGGPSEADEAEEGAWGADES